MTFVQIWAHNGESLSRWITQCDMVKQYATCVKRRLQQKNNITNVEVYVDAWRSLNQRFHQR